MFANAWSSLALCLRSRASSRCGCLLLLLLPLALHCLALPRLALPCATSACVARGALCLLAKGCESFHCEWRRRELCRSPIFALPKAQDGRGARKVRYRSRPEQWSAQLVARGAHRWRSYPLHARLTADLSLQSAVSLVTCSSGRPRNGLCRRHESPDRADLRRGARPANGREVLSSCPLLRSATRRPALWPSLWDAGPALFLLATVS